MQLYRNFQRGWDLNGKSGNTFLFPFNGIPLHFFIPLSGGVQGWVDSCASSIRIASMEQRVMRNKEMDLLKTLGIILVVMGHKHQPALFFYPAYSFHLALFLFVSGYFHDRDYEKTPLNFVLSKAKRLLLPYFIFDAFYALITALLYKNFGILLGELPSPRNFLIDPFLHGHQYHLYIGAWFVPYLFMVQVFFFFSFKLVRKIIKHDLAYLSIYLALGLAGLYIASLPFDMREHLGILLVVRVSFGMLCFYLGYFYKKRIEGLNIFKFSFLLAAVMLESVLMIFFKDVNYELAWGDFNDRILLPIVSTLNGIYIYLFIAKAFTRLLSPNDFVYRIGENSYHIMSHHLLIFFVVNFIIVYYGGFDMSLLNDVGLGFEPDKFWFIYIIPGVLVPTLAALAIGKLKRAFDFKLSQRFEI
jgi:fucose 4-O-acetylase-like acetyltransferase